MSIADIATAAAWITDMEQAVIRWRAQGAVNKIAGHHDLYDEAEVALAALGQLRDALALQRQRIGQARRAEDQRINDERKAREQRHWEERRAIWQDVADHSSKLHEERMRLLRESSDKRHREFLRNLRGERVIARWEIEEL